MRPSSSNNYAANKRGSAASRSNYRGSVGGDDEQNGILQKQLRSLQLEKEKMRELIEELK